MPPIESSHLRFLNEAAQWLGSRSPSTSAHLLGVHTRLLHEELKPLNTHQKKHHCTCGDLRSGTKVTRVSSKRQGRLGAKRGSAVVYKCLRCKQRTVLVRKAPTQPLKQSKPPKIPQSLNTTTHSISAPTSAVASPAPSSTPAETSAPESTSADLTLKAADNANSKKRAKARKQGGLQALLAAKQKTQPSLDLFDFLQ
ncbi:uncharacterized protein N7483_011877 [Penicillium malachiteum]|uniref:uncharacterized protein n=1 Tax=Penicillium malachiteum TaxID=1324776 RepID=UPI002546EF01|nr:uncharacterized protein N7483_011877 [Penicillium malachiteum]KAJ5714696.1 hypothetical protein N7483_011877 [Penicillium malachiteum]